MTPANAIIRCPCGWHPTYPIKDGSRCKRFRCSGCSEWRFWCEGGAPDKRCDYCVTGIGKASARGRAKARGIIFGAPMIRAILAGTKTQTRRIAKFVAIEQGFNLGFSGVEAGHYCTGVPSSGHVLYSRRGDGVWEQRTKPIHCPYGVPGDKLWCRESFGPLPEYPNAVTMPEYEGDHNASRLIYRADEPLNHVSHYGIAWARIKWRSPLFMPKWASRITLEITDVRVERLTSISEEDARAEGARFFDFGKHEYEISTDGGRTYQRAEMQKAGWSTFEATSSEQCLGTARMAFANAWNQIHGGERWNLKPGPSPFDLNSWVWSISFRRVTP